MTDRYIVTRILKPDIVRWMPRKGTPYDFTFLCKDRNDLPLWCPDYHMINLWIFQSMDDAKKTVMSLSQHDLAHYFFTDMHPEDRYAD